jgi:uncharacterized membrane protein
MMKLSWRSELPQLALIAAMFILAAATWPTAPDKIPVHWNIDGQVDRYGGKFEGLLALPLIAAGLYLLLLILPRFDPGYANYGRFAGAYRIIRLSLIVVLTLIYSAIHLSIRGYGIRMESAVPLMIGVMMIVLGNVMGKIRPNWFVGIRTPWTLSSKTSWTRTHRLGGWLFIVMGLSIIGMAVVPGVCVLWLVIYSYLVWRRDPDRIPPTGTEPANDSAS